MDEKRHMRRYGLVGEVLLKPAGGGLWTKAVLMNISRGGLGLYVKGPLKKNDRVAVKLIYLREGKVTEAEEVQSVVRWVQEIGGHYAAGVKFEAALDRFPNLSACIEFVETASVREKK